jgi:hypothetical protein
MSQHANNGNDSKKESINAIVHIVCVWIIVLLVVGVTSVVVFARNLWELHKIKKTERRE